MIKLDKTKSYYLGDLSKEQREEIKNWLVTETDNWNTKSEIIHDYLYFDTSVNKWLQTPFEKESVVNALELFYNLENVQVDCRELSKEQIKEMFDIYINNKYIILHNNYNFASKLCFESEYFFIKQDSRDVFVGVEDEEKHTITYDKFIELFSKEEKPLNEEKPQHYSKGIDTFKRMEENCTLEERLAFAKGNIDKYTWRTKGQDKEDFEKIISYAKWAIKQLENEQSTK